MDLETRLGVIIDAFISGLRDDYKKDFVDRLLLEFRVEIKKIEAKHDCDLYVKNDEQAVLHVTRDKIRHAVLESIKRDCSQNDECSKCPFYIDFGLHKSCVFSGPHVSDGAVPADWDLGIIDN